MSSAEQALGTSHEDQKNAMTAYAKSRGLKVAEFYVEAESGIRAKEERRQEMKRLLRDLRPGDLILCDKIDRWSRNAEFTLRSTREIEDAGASWYAVHEHCDSGEQGRFILTVRAAMAEDEHARIKVRMVGTRKLLRNQGLYADGLVPLGYVRSLPKGAKGLEKNVLRIDPEGAKVVRRIFALCIGGKSIAQIAQAVELGRDRIISVLDCRTYLGQVKDSEGHWIKGRHEAILDADTFTRANAALSGRRLGSAKPSGTPSETSTWILRDVAKCGRCGARMTAAYAGPKGEGRRHYYACRKRCQSLGTRATHGSHVPVRAIEAEAEPMIVARLLELKDELARAGPAPVAPKAVDSSAQRARLSARRDRFLEQHADGMIDTATLRTKLAAVDAASMKLDAEADAAKRPSPLADKKVRRDVLAGVEKIEKATELVTVTQKIEMVNILVVEMRLVNGKKPVPVWRNSEEMAAEVQ